MPYIVTLEALKNRAMAHDPERAFDIAKCDVTEVAQLIDRYPAIVPAKYLKCHIESSVHEPSGSWLIEIDAQKPRTANSDGAILDDGEFFIKLNCNYEAGDAPGFLNRRRSHGVTTPGGYECVGGFDKARDGTWSADVNARYDPETESDCRRIVQGVSRMDAIAALWRERQYACCYHGA